MAQITAALVKELREKTGAGMMDCKKALGETDGDLEAAVDWLRKKGLAAAAKKAGRVAAEGLVGAKTGGTTGAVAEVNSETDFVARNETFQGFVANVTDLAMGVDGDLEALGAQAYPGSERNVSEELTHMISTIGENMSLRRAAVLKVNSGLVASYIHNQTVPGLGKIAVLVALESEAEGAALQALGKQLAMHVAAANPQAVSRDDVDASLLDRERQVLADQARASGKPENIIEKMVEGRLRKYYEEVCLLEQAFVMDPDNNVGKVVEAAGKEAGKPIAVTGFVRYALGEGIDKKEEDFAAEVAAAAGK
ncbi:translation elongation factor Ts [Magnetospira sp. QH-2]|uniref:translation elongation factor Ts n=1 Tax=Magnetospira sp. (strain QH-2) TaxID=1288970 RepID=UPI0003E819F3|nr:translation elongation factor Ts [Magnetospira sp. QH-2]CCQ73987.1 Elongation factor Ts (EF-Ts) [Magnetospira sp. QH-2]